jgi:hypothetical protein
MVVLMTFHASTPSASASVTTEAITHWVEGYLRAWESNVPSDIAALFTGHAEYHESPFEPHWVGRERIIAGWRSRWDWQQGGWTFDWSISAVEGMTVVITGVGQYTELGDFDNVWTVTFDESGLCSRFEMRNTERG